MAQRKFLIHGSAHWSEYMRKFQSYCDYGLVSEDSIRIYIYTVYVIQNTKGMRRKRTHTCEYEHGERERASGESKKKRISPGSLWYNKTMGNEQNRFGSQIQKVRRNKGTKNKPNVKYDFWIRLHEKRINNLQHKLRRKSNRAESTTVSSPRFLLHTIFHLSPAFSLSCSFSLTHFYHTRWVCALLRSIALLRCVSAYFGRNEWFAICHYSYMCTSKLFIEQNNLQVISTIWNKIIRVISLWDACIQRECVWLSECVCVYR